MFRGRRSTPAGEHRPVLLDEVLSALRPLEHSLLPQAVRMFASGELRIDPSGG